ncbi:hypothetical protein Tco_0884017 [Tanacetum coccineum]
MPSPPCLLVNQPEWQRRWLRQIQPSERGIDPLTRHHHHLRPFQYGRDDDTDEDGEDKSLDADDEREEEEVVPGGQQQTVLVVDTAASEPLGLGYGVLRRRELAVEEHQVPSTFEAGQISRSMLEQLGAERVYAFRQPTLTTWVDPEDDRVYTDILTYPPVAPVQTPPSPEWSSGSLPISPSSLAVPSPIASLVATPTATISINKDQFLEEGAQLELHGSILQDHTQILDALPPTLFVDIDRDRENHDLRMQLAEERHERLELADHVVRIERRQEPREE